MNNGPDELKDEGHQCPSRRVFLKSVAKTVASGAVLYTFGVERLLAEAAATPGAAASAIHRYAMGIDIHKCIGCGKCVDACKNENKVPPEPHYFRTWVERYVTPVEGETQVDSPNGGMTGFPEIKEDQEILKTYFVPKLCNHCKNPPCVQVCPVGATFRTPDGVVLVDEKYCVGCRYCIQACPYGARYMHPEKHVADKCTFCYHRITKGLLPACVEVCPTKARIFGEIDTPQSPIRRFMRFTDFRVLKPELNTGPMVFYSGMGNEVR